MSKTNVHHLSTQASILNQYIAELRDESIQGDRMRFRKNLERIGMLMGYEISKQLQYAEREVRTPLGVANIELPTQIPVLATILRAGLPLHNGLLQTFDKADNAFISAYRKHHKGGRFEINLEYVSCPDLNDRLLIISDPMVATGASVDVTINELKQYGEPSEIHLVTAIASTYGIDYIRRRHADIHIWAAAIDDELTGKSYIVPGLGDAGDLAFGDKLQE